MTTEVTEFYQALVNGQKQECNEQALAYLKEHNSILKLYEDLIRPALYEVGRMWENNLISVATEHLASAIVQTILNSQYHKVVHQKAQTNRRVVLACVENELHQIGITMASDIFELHAWNTYFLGVNVPTDELIEFIQTVKPNVLALTMSLEFHTPSLIQMLTQIRMNFPDLVIVLGGQAFENDQVQIPFIFKVAVLKTLDELDTFLSTSEA